MKIDDWVTIVKIDPTNYTTDDSKLFSDTMYLNPAMYDCINLVGKICNTSTKYHLVVLFNPKDGSMLESWWFHESELKIVPHAQNVMNLASI